MRKRKPAKTNKMSQALFVLGIMAIVSLLADPVFAQEQQTDSYPVGNPLGMTTDGDFEPISSNVTVYGGIYRAEACIYAPKRDLIVVPSRGVPQQAHPLTPPRR